MVRIQISKSHGASTSQKLGQQNVPSTILIKKLCQVGTSDHTYRLPSLLQNRNGYKSEILVHNKSLSSPYLWSWHGSQAKVKTWRGLVLSRSTKQIAKMERSCPHYCNSHKQTHTTHLVFAKLTKTKSSSDGWANAQRENKPDWTNNNNDDDETWLKTQKHKPGALIPIC
jgi:hypothetical protein